MASILTFNQVIDLLQDIAQRSYLINTFFLGRDWELENDNDIVYPVLQVYPEFARMPQTNGDFKTLNVRLICKVVDLVNQNESNEKDVHSDTLRISQDIVNEINQHPYYQRSNANIIGDIDFTNLEEYEDDFAAGWEFTLNLQLINNNSYCGLPFEELPGYSASGPVSSGYSYSVQYLTCNNLTDCQIIEEIQNDINILKSQVTSIFAQTGDSISITNTITETTLIDGGVGSLSVPSNGFKIGDSFRVKMGGVISNQNNHLLRIRLKSGSVVLADSGIQQLDNHLIDIWDLDIDFTIRNIGSNGTASILTLGKFKTTKKNNNNIKGFSFDTLNNTTFDTTIPNTLDITLEWGQSSSSDIIYTRTFVLNKTY